MDCRYLIARAASMHVFAADDQAAVFDAERDSTHLLDEVAAAVFAALQVGPMTAPDLVALLAQAYPDDPPDEQAAAVAAALAALQAHGLVDVAP
jgi:PqqD family protein of HPr-rel-A system